MEVSEAGKVNWHQLLGTSGHFSCGLIETRSIHSDDQEQTLSGLARGNGGDETTLSFHAPPRTQLHTAICDGVPTTADHPGLRVVALPIPVGDNFRE